MTPLESLARHLCKEAGGNPDRLEPVTIIHGDPKATGVARHSLTGDRPRWHRYAPFARNWLAAKEKAHVDLNS